MVDYPLHIVDTQAQITHRWLAHYSVGSSFVHGAYTQDIKFWESQTKVYQLKVNPKYSVTSIHQEISSAKEE